MTASQKVRAFKSNTPEYHDAFQVFLDHTDQKHQAKQWLETCINGLPSKGLFVDAGAGNGKVTTWFADAFARTIATEPNESLRKELEAACPGAEVLGDTIMEARISDPADFVLSSHVFYYIPGAEWPQNLDKMASWLAPKGTLVVIIQNHGTDCMKILRHFLKQSFDLKSLADAFGKKSGAKYDTSLETVPAKIQTEKFEDACTIAEFMLNLLPLEDPPLRADVESYVRKNFAFDGGFRFSCNQDFLRIRAK